MLVSSKCVCLLPHLNTIDYLEMVLILKCDQQKV